MCYCPWSDEVIMHSVWWGAGWRGGELRGGEPGGGGAAGPGDGVRRAAAVQRAGRRRDGRRGAVRPVGARVRGAGGEDRRVFQGVQAGGARRRRRQARRAHVHRPHQVRAAFALYRWLIALHNKQNIALTPFTDFFGMVRMRAGHRATRTCTSRRLQGSLTRTSPTGRYLWGAWYVIVPNYREKRKMLRDGIPFG